MKGLFCIFGVKKSLENCRAGGEEELSFVWDEILYSQTACGVVPPSCNICSALQAARVPYKLRLCQQSCGIVPPSYGVVPFKLRQCPTSCVIAIQTAEVPLQAVRLRNKQGWELAHRFSQRIAHFWWATWAICSQSLFSSEQPERIAHGCSFLVSNLSHSLTSLIFSIKKSYIKHT